MCLTETPNENHGTVIPAPLTFRSIIYWKLEVEKSF